MSGLLPDYAKILRSLVSFVNENPRGTIEYKSRAYAEREMLIGKFVQGLAEKNSVAIRIAPAITSESSPMSLLAQRFAWVLFQEQFPVNLRWAVHRDPYYVDTGTCLLPDTTQLTIQTCAAASEKRYRTFLRSARKALIKGTVVDPFVNPLTTQIHSSESSKESSSSSHSSSNSPITMRNLRTTREATIATAPSSSSLGFAVSRRRRVVE